MTTPVVIIAPPQTSCSLNMARAWTERSPAAAAILREADAVLGDSLGVLPSTLVLHHCAQTDSLQSVLSRTDWSQLAVYVSCIACWAGVLEADVVSPSSVIAASGLSFGEVTCLTIAGAISFADGLRMVRKRAIGMQKAAAGELGGVLCVTITDEETLQDIVGCARRKEVLSILRTKNTTTLLTGNVSALQRAQSYAQERYDATSFFTEDCTAFHSELMRSAVAPYSAALAEIPIGQPAFPVISCTTLSEYDAANARDLLVHNVTSRLDWLGACAKLKEMARGKGAAWLVLDPGQSSAADIGRMKVGISNIVHCDVPEEVVKLLRAGA